jgi:DNA-directed RNA polymerase specialized sigma24 family protein
MIVQKLKEIGKLKFRIKILEDKIKELRCQIEGHAVRYSELPKIHGFDNIFQVQIERLVELETKKTRLQMKIDIILDELDGVPELQYKIIYYKFIDNLSWREIAKKVEYSVTQCHRFYNDALNCS